MSEATAKDAGAKATACCRSKSAVVDRDDDSDDATLNVSQRPCTPDPVEIWVSQMPRTLAVCVAQAGFDALPAALCNVDSRWRNLRTRPAVPPPKTPCS